jgi:hypothetical protein
VLKYNKKNRLGGKNSTYVHYKLSDRDTVNVNGGGNIVNTKKDQSCTTIEKVFPSIGNFPLYMITQKNAIKKLNIIFFEYFIYFIL